MTLSAVAHPQRQRILKVAAEVAGLVAAQIEAGQVKPAAKSIEGMAIDFEVRLSEAVTDFFNGDTSAADVGRVMRQLIRGEAMDMYQEGMREGGIEDPEAELSDDDETAVAEWISTQLEHVHDFILAMKETNKADDRTAAQQAILNRMELWRGSLENLGSLGKASAQTNKMVTWVYGDTDHCDTCERLNGKRRRLQWFLDNDYKPQENGSITLACHGYRCQCRLVDDKGNQVMP